MYTGVVERGSQSAAGLGYPTINIPLADTDVSGIFAAEVSVEDAVYFAAAYANPARGILEAHLLDFSGEPAQTGELYGKRAEIELLEKIREDKKFDDEAALKDAIAQDVQAVREYFHV